MVIRYAVEIKEGDAWRRVEGKTFGARDDEDAQRQAQRRFPQQTVRAVRYHADGRNP